MPLRRSTLRTSVPLVIAPPSSPKFSTLITRSAVNSSVMLVRAVGDRGAAADRAVDLEGLGRGGHRHRVQLHARAAVVEAALVDRDAACSWPVR